MAVLPRRTGEVSLAENDVSKNGGLGLSFRKE